MATEKDRITTKIIIGAVLPVIKVMLEDDPVMKTRFQQVNGVIQFVAKDKKERIGAHVKL